MPARRFAPFADCLAELSTVEPGGPSWFGGTWIAPGRAPIGIPSLLTYALVE